jgi:hypothetical protein
MAGYAMNLRNDRAQKIIDDIGAAGILNIMGGTRPATGAAAGAPLGQIPLKSPAGTLNTATATINFTKPNDAQATGTGSCTWARITDSSNNPLIDLSVSDTTGNGEVQLNTLSISPGLWMSVQTMQVTEGNP